MNEWIFLLILVSPMIGWAILNLIGLIVEGRS